MSNRVYESIWETLHTTSLIKTNNLIPSNEVQHNLYVKCEFQNPTGKFTDRIANLLFNHLVDNNKIIENQALVLAYKKNFTHSFASRAVKGGYKVVIFYDNTADIKEISYLNFLGV